MLESAVITITKAFDVLYTTSSAIFFPFFKQIIACKILPPSNGYIGTRFKIASNTFVFTIILLAFICIKLNNIEISILMNGPALAMMI